MLSKRFALIFLLGLAPARAHAQAISTPGWHSIPKTAVCGGGAESNPTFLDPDTFPNNLNATYTSFGYSFSSNCYQLVEDSNSAVMDTLRHRLLIFGGGHQHYWGNDILSLELSNIGTANPAMFHLDHAANPLACPATGPASTTTTTGGNYCSYGSGGLLSYILQYGACSYVASCNPTTASLGTVHTYEGITYIPPSPSGAWPNDEMGVFGGASSPLGNAMENVWMLNVGTVLSSCAPTPTGTFAQQQGCNPAWTPIGNPLSNNTYTNPDGVGVVSGFDQATQLVWLQNQTQLTTFNPATSVLTNVASTSGIGYHSSGVIDPVDEFFIFIGPCWNASPANGASGCGAAGNEGINYVNIATGASHALQHPSTTGCNTIVTGYNGTNLPAAQYQGIVWDPIARQVVIYPNGTNTIWLLDPKTWVCTSETYGSVQGTDYPQTTPLTGSSANGTFSHFNYDRGLDLFPVCNDPFNDCWYLHRRRGDPMITNETGSTITNKPISVAQAFRDGDIPSGLCPLAYQDSSGASTSITTQTDAKNYWPDGSLKFAIESFIIPTIAPAQVVRVVYDVQSCPANTGQLTQANMLSTSGTFPGNAGNWNFDAQIQLANTTTSITHNISARTILSGASSISDCTGSDPDGTLATSGVTACYWLKGPIVTAVLLEDRNGRTFDVNMDGTTGNPLHPRFEAWFWPQTGDVQVGYALEDSWASTTGTNSARDQTFTSVVLTGGNTAPITLSYPGSGSGFTQITRSMWHKTFCINGSQAGTAYDCNGTTLHIDHDYPYLAQTKFFPNWDPTVVIAPTKIASEYAGVFSGSSPQAIFLGGCSKTPACNITGNGSGGGAAYYPAGLDGTGSGEFHGPLTTWQIIRLMTQCDAGNSTTALCGNGSGGNMAAVDYTNSDIGGAVPYFYREADTNAGFGQTFDNSGIPGHVATQGRVVSINARTQVSLTDTTAQTCSTNHAADWINFGTGGQDTGVWGTGQMDTTHWPNLAYTAYLMSGQYAYYEQQVMQSAYALAASPGSRACINATGGANRQGSAGYWYIDQERGTDWMARENFLGWWIAVDGSPEKAYFLDKIRANTAVWEGVHNIAYNTPGSYTAAWTFGNTVRINYPAGGTNLGSWSIGPSNGPNGAYPPVNPMCNGTNGNPPGGSVVNTGGNTVTFVSGAALNFGGFTTPGGLVNINGTNYTVSTVNSTTIVLTTTIGTLTGAFEAPGAIGLNAGGFCQSAVFANAPNGANSNFQNAYSSVMLGWMNDIGLCPQASSQCEFLTYTSNHFLNEALNPASNPFHLSDYVYPTLDVSGGQITTWTEDQTFYVPGGQPTAWPTNNSSFDEWYVGEDASAMSYMTGITSSQGGYSGQAAYNLIDSGGRKPLETTFNACNGGTPGGTGSPKWCMVPRTFTAVPGAPSSIPTVNLSPASLFYGNQPIGQASSFQTVTLTNTGTATLNITSIGFTGANASNFTLISNTCGSTLGVGLNCTMQITFKPLVVQSYSASLTFTTNATTSPDNVTITATGVLSAPAGSPGARAVIN